MTIRMDVGVHTCLSGKTWNCLYLNIFAGFLNNSSNVKRCWDPVMYVIVLIYMSHDKNLAD